MKDPREYLENSGIKQDKKYETPINRLIEINPKAYQLYLDNAIDILKNPLEIAVCVQNDSFKILNMGFLILFLQGQKNCR